MILNLSWITCEISSFPFFDVGIYVCSKCDHPLFSSHTKYEHQTPWPAFSSPVQTDSLSKKPETEHQESSDCRALKVGLDSFKHP